MGPSKVSSVQKCSKGKRKRAEQLAKARKYRKIESSAQASAERSESHSDSVVAPHVLDLHRMLVKETVTTSQPILCLEIEQDRSSRLMCMHPLCAKTV